MIEKNDVRAAVSAGILTEAQAASVIALADSRNGARESLSNSDEPFELFRGFNEIFIVVGLIILAMGWIGVVTFGTISYAQHLKTYLIVAGICGAAITWLLSEYFIRRRRMTAPAITLAVLFAGNAIYGFSSGTAQIFMLAQNDFSSLPLPLGLATLAMMGYWLRFRVPFALAIIALSTFLVSILYAGTRSGNPEDWRDLFMLSADGPFAIITLSLGLVVFGIAMRFDMSDPHRVTRRSANGFWLHVIAAPALVNTVALSLLDQNTTANNFILFGFLTFFAIVAIVIDRRSFLITAIGYIVALSRTVFDVQDAAITVFALGIFLVFLGARWERIRAFLMKFLPRIIPRHRLPPCS
ncbi:MAG: hypothetical protein ABJQ70_12015 [Roseobacter sp.]